jgi:hypothetical protein
LLGNGSGGFSASAVSPLVAGSNPFALAVGDFNGDGIQDIAVANTFLNNVTILLGDGTGKFVGTAISPLAVGAEPVALAAADFNGDGIQDIAVANWTDGTVTVLLGFTAGNTPQTITFNPPSSVTNGIAPFTISGSASSGLPVSFASSAPAVCNVAGTTVAVVAAGTCSIVASQAGNATYAAAATVTQTFVVNRYPQTITFGALGDVSLGTAPFAVSASANTGLPVLFNTTTTSVCSVTPGGTVTILGLGTCSVTATQAGNGIYAMASVTQSFSVVTGAACSLMNVISPAVLRQEGTAERISDLVLSCSGGNGLPMNVTATLLPSVNITSKILGSGNNATSEALAGLNSRQQLSRPPSAGSPRETQSYLRACPQVPGHSQSRSQIFGSTRLRLPRRTLPRR